MEKAFDRNEQESWQIMAKAKHQSFDLTALYPVRPAHIPWSQEESGAVTLEIENKGAANRIAQKLLKKPNLKRCEFNEYKTWVFSNYLLATGNRISTVLNLQIRDLDFDNNVIQLNKMKNRKAQIVPMASSLAVILKEYLTYRKGELDDYVFCNSYGGQGEIRSYQEMLAKYNKARGVSKTSAHLYRHTFAKRWILNGGDIFRLQKLLGHSDLTVVKEYVNMFSSDLSKDYSDYNPLDTLGTVRNQAKVGFNN